MRGEKLERRSRGRRGERLGNRARGGRAGPAVAEAPPARDGVRGWRTGPAVRGGPAVAEALPAGGRARSWRTGPEVRGRPGGGAPEATDRPGRKNNRGRPQFFSLLPKYVVKLACSRLNFEQKTLDKGILARHNGLLTHSEGYPSGQRGQTVNLLAMPS